MKARRELPSPPPLYDGDYYSWALQQADVLRERRFAELDLVNLIDEVEALARGEARELRHRYVTILLHLLKWEFQPERRSTSWIGTIQREREEVAEHLLDNPGLKPRRAELFARAYRSARAGAAGETGMLPARFPDDNPYTLEQATDPGFWPGGDALPGGDRAGGEG